MPSPEGSLSPPRGGGGRKQVGKAERGSTREAQDKERALHVLHRRQYEAAREANWNADFNYDRDKERGWRRDPRSFAYEVWTFLCSRCPSFHFRQILSTIFALS